MPVIRRVYSAFCRAHKNTSGGNPGTDFFGQEFPNAVSSNVSEATDFTHTIFGPVAQVCGLESIEIVGGKKSGWPKAGFRSLNQVAWLLYSAKNGIFTLLPLALLINSKQKYFLPL